MGCEGSKSAAVEERTREERARTASTAPDPNKQEDVWITLKDAVRYVQKVLGVSEAKAKQLVGHENLDNDDKVANEELLRLWNKITTMKAQLDELFLELDKDKSGSVTTIEAVGALKARFEGADDKALLKLIKRFDENGDGKINYDEFVVFYCFISAKKKELVKTFSEMDRDNSGVLDAAEVRKGLMEVCAMNEKQARSLVDEFDISMDDKISKQEFTNMWMQIFPDLNEDNANES